MIRFVNFYEKSCCFFGCYSFTQPLMPVGLLFSGQGAQHVGMGLSLYENSNVARDVYDRADQVLGWNLSKICFEGPLEELTNTSVCQPALFIMGIAGAAILKERGLIDDLGAALGLSLGELTALTVAEAFDFETGLKVVAERGRLMQEACESTDGSMASLIGGSLDAIRAICEACDVDMANLNCPGQIVISGESEKIAKAVEAANATGDFKRVIPLTVAGAYHSRLMEKARQAFAAYLETVAVKEPKVPVFTNTTGLEVKTPDEIRTALGKQVVSSVLWEDCMLNAARLDIDKFYECGPGKVLMGLGRRIDRSISIVPITEYSNIPE